ncbi:MAG: UDP-N-acetylmuramate dehydrogenase [bacterium]|nr:UDP-N-acetylmuramate dehydrogenase [bacterium]
MKLKKDKIFTLTGIVEKEVLAPYTSFKIGGPAKYFFVAKSNKDVIKAIKIAKENEINYFILGNGSNILVSDKGFDGLVIKMENTSIEIKDEFVTAEAGVKVQKLIRETITNNLSGLEYLIGIPGTLGGGVAGNIGTPNLWIDKNLVEVYILNSKNMEETLLKSQCDFSYRYSRFKNNDQEIILGAKFKLLKSNQKLIQQNVKEFLSKRIHQPVNQPCAGSIFKNPEDHKSWQLIDEVKLRGKRIGGAKVSEEHSNFIINTGKATAEDVVVLISLIKQQVRDKLGIQLNEEIKYIGFD